MTMRFDELSPSAKTAYKRRVLQDFTDHGMSEQEALINYVFCVNPDPIKWLEHRYGISKENAEVLRSSGLATYKANGGTGYCRNMERAIHKKQCTCKKPIVPKFD
jgi:hypothetical protein